LAVRADAMTQYDRLFGLLCTIGSSRGFVDLESFDSQTQNTNDSDDYDYLFHVVTPSKGL